MYIRCIKYFFCVDTKHKHPVNSRRQFFQCNKIIEIIYYIRYFIIIYHNKKYCR